MLYLMDTATRKLMLSEIFSSLYFTKGIIKKILGYSDSIYCIIDRKTLYSVTFIFTMSTSCSVTQKKDDSKKRRNTFQMPTPMAFSRKQKILSLQDSAKYCTRLPALRDLCQITRLYRINCMVRCARSSFFQLLLRCCNKSRSSRSVV